MPRTSLSPCKDVGTKRYVSSRGAEQKKAILYLEETTNNETFISEIL